MGNGLLGLFQKIPGVQDIENAVSHFMGGGQPAAAPRPAAPAGPGPAAAPRPQAAPPASRPDLNPLDMAVKAVQHAGQSMFNFVHPVTQEVAKQIPEAAKATQDFINNTYKSNQQASANLIEKPAQGIYDTGREAAGLITGNKTAAANAATAVKNDYAAPAQTLQGLAQSFVTRPMAQVGESILQVTGAPGNAGTYTPESGTEKAIFGDKPVQSFQQGYVTTRDNPALKGLPAPERAALGGLYTAGQVVQDAPVIGKVLGGAHLATAAAVRGGAKAILNTDRLTQAVKQVQLANSGAEDVSGAKPETTPNPGPQESVPGSKGPAGQSPVPGTSPTQSTQNEASSSAQPSTKPFQAQGGQPDKYGKTMLNQRIREGNPYSYADYQKDVKKFNIEDPLSKEDFKTANLDGRNTVLKSPEENLKANPQNGKFSLGLDKIKGGAYKAVQRIPGVVGAPLHAMTEMAAAAIGKLSAADKANWNHFVEGTMDYTKEAEHPDQVKFALQAHKYLTDRVHLVAQQLGHNINYVDNYVKHYWQTDPNEAEQSQQAANTGKGTTALKSDQKNRVVTSYKEGQDIFGLKPKYADPVEAERQYGHVRAMELQNLAMGKALKAADAGALTKEGKPAAANKTIYLNGKAFSVTDKAYEALKAFHTKGGEGDFDLAIKGQNAAKKLLLSLSQYHPTNINVLQAAPALALRGHPMMAAKGIFDTFASLNKDYAARLQEKAMTEPIGKEGSTVYDGAARMGTPIGSEDFNLDKSGSKIGNQDLKDVVFGRQIPAMHIQMVKAAMQDLEKRGLSLDSPEAAELGKTVNHIMGFVNNATANISPHLMEMLSNFLLAPQFEGSKLALVEDAFKPGLAGNYARASIFGKHAVTFAAQLGIGKVTGQTSNNWRDQLVQNLFSPQAATGMTDAKGNNIAIKLPDSGASEAANLIFHPERNTDTGRLDVKLNSIGQGWDAFMKDVGNKGAPVARALEELHGNENYAGRQIFEPDKPLTTQAAEAAAGIIPDTLLPIGLQGVPYTNTVKDLVGKVSPSAKAVLDANTPGENPVLKSAASTFAMTPVVDKTTGKGLETATSIEDQKKATAGLNDTVKKAFDLVFGSKKNEVTGEYDNTPANTNMSMLTRDKSDLLRTYPEALQAANAKARMDAAKGLSVDPFYTKLTPDQQQQILDLQGMPAGGPDPRDWHNRNDSWYQGFAQQQNEFYNSLPKGDPNKPKNPIEFPNASEAQTAAQNVYNSLPQDAAHSATRAAYLKVHPELTDLWASQEKYDNEMRVAQGFQPLKVAGNASPEVQKYITTYEGASKATRSSMRNSNPAAYKQMVAYFDNQDLSTINKQGAVSEIQGEPDATQSELKAISGLAPDIVKGSGTNPYSVVPAAWMSGLTSANGQGSSFKKSSSNYSPYDGIKGVDSPLLNFDKKAGSVPSMRPKGLPKLRNTASSKLARLSKVSMTKPKAGREARQSVKKYRV